MGFRLLTFQYSGIVIADQILVVCMNQVDIDKYCCGVVHILV